MARFPRYIFSNCKNSLRNYHVKGELKLAKKHLTMKQIQSIMSKLDNNGDGTISWKEMKK